MGYNSVLTITPNPFIDIKNTFYDEDKCVSTHWDGWYWYFRKLKSNWAVRFSQINPNALILDYSPDIWTKPQPKNVYNIECKSQPQKGYLAMNPFSLTLLESSTEAEFLKSWLLYPPSAFSLSESVPTQHWVFRCIFPENNYGLEQISSQPIKT